MTSASARLRDKLRQQLVSYATKRGLALNHVVVSGREELRIGLQFQAAKRLKGVVARFYVAADVPAVRAYSRLPVAEASRFAASKPVIDPSMRSLTSFEASEILPALEDFLDRSLDATRQAVSAVS